MNGAYYNEIDPFAAQWLRNLIAAGHIAPGDVDERSIVDVRPDDLTGYTQCHFFAGIGGWSYAARLAGWPDDRELWTGSCPCQPFSVAGAGKGQADERHLWPTFFNLIAAKSPAVVMGEQVAAAVGKHWLDGVCADLEGVGYSVGAAVVPACAVDAPHRRDRLWFVADAAHERVNRGRDTGPQRRIEPANSGGHVADAHVTIESEGREQRGGELSGELSGVGLYTIGSALAHAASEGRGQAGCDAPSNSKAHGGWARNWHGDAGPSFIAGADGKARRVEPSIRLLAHGVPARVGKLRAYGNAIVPQVAAEVIGAYIDLRAA